MAITRFKGLWGNANALNNPPVAIDPGVLQMDGAISIYQLPIPLADAGPLVNAALTDNNAGQANAPDISINVGAGVTGGIILCVSEYLKEVASFLSSSSVPPVNNSGFLADDSGDTWPSKGTKVTSIELAYQVITNPLTSLNVRADVIQFKATGGVNTALFANTNQVNSLAVTGAAGVGNAMTVITIPMTTQQFDILDNTQMYIKIAPVVPGGGAFRLYSVVLNITGNYL
jgi:hypothetical protein